MPPTSKKLKGQIGLGLFPAPLTPTPPQKKKKKKKKKKKTTFFFRFGLFVKKIRRLVG